MIRVYTLLLSYYALGIAAIAVINARKKDADTKARWTKLVVYLIITGSLTSLLGFAPRLAVAAAILITATGLFELLMLHGLAGLQRLFILSSYCVTVPLFCLFIARSVAGTLPCIVYLVVLTFDGFSQIFGQVIGGRKIAPRISPGKTYSGFAGGLGMGIITAALLEGTLATPVLGTALAVCLLAFTGDMIASAVKRRAGVKDYSSLIPGHGGVLDRFDSFIFAGAMLELYFRVA